MAMHGLVRCCGAALAREALAVAPGISGHAERLRPIWLRGATLVGWVGSLGLHSRLPQGQSAAVSALAAGLTALTGARPVHHLLRPVPLGYGQVKYQNEDMRIVAC